MEIKVLKDEKENLIVEIDNQTVAELLRVYLNENDAVQLAAWKREHPEKPVVFELRTKGKVAKKILEDAVDMIQKDTSKIVEEFKKAIK